MSVCLLHIFILNELTVQFFGLSTKIMLTFYIGKGILCVIYINFSVIINANDAPFPFLSFFMEVFNVYLIFFFFFLTSLGLTF